MLRCYWFRPKRFWGYFAFYYPSSKEGWIITLVLVVSASEIFLFIDGRSHSVSDTLIGFAPWGVVMAALFDLLCFRFGEYPSWWKRHGKKLEK